VQAAGRADCCASGASALSPGLSPEGRRE